MSNFTESDQIIRGNNKYTTSRRARTKRNSKFRGVSLNGGAWQVMVLTKGNKFYKGGIRSEKKAARLYDKICIRVHGLKAKTNFSYSQKEVVQILGPHAEEHNDLKLNCQLGF